MLETTDGCLDLRTRGAEIGAVGDRSRDEFVHCQLGTGLGVHQPGGSQRAQYKRREQSA